MVRTVSQPWFNPPCNRWSDQSNLSNETATAIVRLEPSTRRYAFLKISQHRSTQRLGFRITITSRKIYTLGGLKPGAVGFNSGGIESAVEGGMMAVGMGVVVTVGVAVGGLLLLTGIALGLSILCHPLWLVRWIQKLQPHILYLVPTKEKIVALTLDDGPHAHITPQLLDILQENESRATWFIIGDHMDPCPSIVDRIHAEGHEVGNHTMQDVASWRLSKEEFEEQLVRVDSCIKAYFHQDTSGRPIKWFRPGHGFFNLEIVKTCRAHGYQVALGSLYPMDHMFEKQAKLLVRNILWRIHPGAIIILHDRVPQVEQTPQVLRLLLPELRKRGYKIVTLSELTSLTKTTVGKRSD